MRDTKQQFEKRLHSFGRVRRAVVNAVLFYYIGAIALGTGIAALVLLCGWTANPLVNVVIALAALGTLAWLFVRLIIRWERRRTALSEGFRAESLAGGLNSRLISAVDFLDREQSTPLTEVVIRRAGEDLELKFEKMLDRTARNRLGIRFVLLLVFFLLLGSTEQFGFVRMLRTVGTSAFELREMLFPTRFELIPGPGEHVYRIGEKVETGLKFTRFRYPEVTMVREVKGTEGEERTILKVGADDMASVVLKPTLEQEYFVRFEFGKRVTGEMKILFTAVPVIENMQVELVYPLYTRMVPKEMEGIIDRVTALAGTRINMGFAFSKAVNSAVLTFDDGSRMPLDVVGRFASVSFVHSQERTAELVVEDIHGFAMERPHTVEFGVTKDQPPKLIVPRDYTTDMRRTLEEFAGFTPWARVEDDFGAAKCLVKWHRSKTDEPGRILEQGEPVERAFIPPRPKAVAVFENIFREQAQAAEAGDLFTFHMEAADNREPKPQVSISAVFSIYIRGADLADGIAGSLLQITGGGTRPFGQAVQRIYLPQEGSRAIRKPSKQITSENYKSDYTKDRSTTVRGEPRGAPGSTAGNYAAAITGAK